MKLIAGTNPFMRVIIFLLSLFIFTSSPAQSIYTVAGNGYNGNIGDGGPAICAGTPYPQGVCADRNGDFYFTCSNAIRKVTAATGIISTVCGSDTYGDSGDGGQAVNALMKFPIAVCIDINKNLYIAEYSGQRIRKINTSTGIISTIAGTGTAGFSGDGGPATSASLNTPKAVNVDADGNVYFADSYNSRIRKIDAATGIITTIAGTGSTASSGDGGPAVNAGVPYPVSIGIDATGNLYIAEVNGASTCRIRKITIATGIITTVAGNSSYGYSGDGGLAVNASLFDPSGVCTDASGNIYICEYDDSRIRKIDAATGIITTIAGNGTNGFSGDGNLAVGATFHSPVGICADINGNLYIADNFNNRIREIGTVNTVVSVPTISISASGNNACSGNPIVFTATTTGAGASPVFSWKINGVNAGTNSNSYSSAALSKGDVISCTLTVTNCNGTSTVSSNSITVAAGTGGTPSATIAAGATTICSGAMAIFTASVSNCGTNPSFQWKINGANVGSNNAGFSSISLANGDMVSCTVIVDPLFTCATAPGATSNTIVMTVTTEQAPSVNIAASGNDVCPGTPITFTALAQNAGATPSYQWQLNGANAGSNSTAYTSNSFSNNDKINCLLTAVGNHCATAPVGSNTVVMIIKNLPSVTLSPADTTVFAGSLVQLKASLSAPALSYEWTPAGTLTNAASLSPNTLPLTASTTYTFSLLSTDSCTSSKTIAIKVLRKIHMPDAFTPNGDGNNDAFRIPPNTYLNLKEFSVYDRWGNKIFTTSDITKGWDGRKKGIPQEMGVYVYIVSGADTSGTVLLKGTFLLIR